MWSILKCTHDLVCGGIETVQYTEAGIEGFITAEWGLPCLCRQYVNIQNLETVLTAMLQYKLVLCDLKSLD
jgi:hypothetical protein